jgi:hypothetical protein
MNAGKQLACNNEGRQEAGMQAGKEACSKNVRQAGRQARMQELSKACRNLVRHAGINKGINAGWHVRRQRSRNDGREALRNEGKQQPKHSIRHH